MTAISLSPRTPRRRTRTPVAAEDIVSVPTFDAASDYLDLYHAEPMARVRLVRQGVPARLVGVMATHLDMPRERLMSALGLARATVDRKVRERKPLSRDDGAKVVGLARLIGQVEAMVRESGRAEGFDAAAWVSQWLVQPLSALNGHQPVELLDTPDGQALVSNLLARMQSGAYA